MTQETQRPQWFIAADGTVIQSWPPGPDNDRLKYVRYSTNRRIELSDLYALDERIDRFWDSLNRRSRVLLLVIALDVVGIVLAWLILPRFGVSTNVMLVLTAVSALLLFLAGPITRAISGGSRAGFDQIYLDAGFESSVPKVLKDGEAQAIIEAPGTVSGRQR